MTLEQAKKEGLPCGPSNPHNGGETVKGEGL